MPRQPREHSHFKVYHAILRGVNKQQIFECSEDYEHFVHILQHLCGWQVDTRPSVSHNLQKREQLASKLTMPLPKELDDQQESAIRHCFIYAWCLMGNHIHLLIQENDEPIGDSMKRITSSYVYYYNHKYDRIGHLFQERFKSQPVESWDYFLTLLRYIHQNPMKPHLVADLKDYPWSSWREYLGISQPPFTSIQTVLRRIDITELTAIIEKPMDEEEEDGLLDAYVQPKAMSYNNEQVWDMIEYYCGANTPSQFQALSRPQQKHVLYCVHEEGVGPRTLSRLTGVPYSIVQRATSAANERLLQSSVIVSEPTPEDDLFLTYCDEGTFDKYPEY